MRQVVVLYTVIVIDRFDGMVFVYSDHLLTTGTRHIIKNIFLIFSSGSV